MTDFSRNSYLTLQKNRYIVTYTKILTIADVEDFTRQLVAEGTNVHPDDDFIT
jgi:hypothetical protein